MKKILLLVGVCVSVFTTYAATSPVVQVVAYKEPLGLYFSLQGWGSGSVIDNQGHIITNNHVVDDGTGGISDDFAICMTDNPSLPPRCHYTASVVTRDPDTDIAILQLDAVDIFGKSVDFTALSTLTMDMDYLPHSGDSVVARGYPWIGANTITETQGIVSGTAQYNGKKYIKTDTLIAGGNSGGPLIRDGKMIGVNTFLVGGGYDPSLGYSLLIGEAADLIDSALSATEKLQSNSDGFASFLQKIDMFSVQKKIVDPLVTFNLSEKYHIDSYIPSMTLQASLSDGSSTSVTAFGFYHMSTPRISDQKELKKYIFSQFSLGEDEGFDFQTIVIGGIPFYEIIDKENPENNALKSERGYITMLDDTHMMILFLATPSPTKNTADNIQKSVKNFLDNISFPPTFNFSNVKNIVIPQSGIEIAVRRNSSISYSIDEYQGLLSYQIQNRQDFVMVRDYLGNFWSKAQVSIFRNSFETQNDSIDTWMKNTIEAGYRKPLVKKKVTYQGNEGFLACFSDSIMDEFGKMQDVIMCESVFLVGDTHDYIVSTQMVLDKKQLKRIDMLMVQYIDRILQVPDIGETTFGGKDSLMTPPYSDVGNQSQAYQEALRTLISYGVLQDRPVFEGDTPLKWKEYFSLFIWSVYHKKMTDTIDPNNTESPTFEEALSVLPLAKDDYAEDDKWGLDNTHDLIRLLVAGGSLPSYDFDTVLDFSGSRYESDGVYRDAWDTLNAFEATYFPDRVPMESVKYTPESVVTYNPFTDLTIEPKNSTDKDEFFRDNAQYKDMANKILNCERSSLIYFSTECRDMRKKALLDSLSYPVLTKGRAIEYILSFIDESLWNAAAGEPQ